MSKKKQDFIPESNIDWVAQQIVNGFSEKQLMELEACFAKIDQVVYKSWVNDLTFADLKEAVKIAKEISEPRKHRT